MRRRDAATGEELVRLPGHATYAYALAFRPDGATLASGSGDFTICLWDTAPLRTRYQARREAAALRPQAERLVEQLWRGKNGRSMGLPARGPPQAGRCSGPQLVAEAAVGSAFAALAPAAKRQGPLRFGNGNCVGVSHARSKRGCWAGD